jgi:hypothetical protein
MKNAENIRVSALVVEKESKARGLCPLDPR